MRLRTPWERGRAGAAVPGRLTVARLRLRPPRTRRGRRRLVQGAQEVPRGGSAIWQQLELCLPACLPAVQQHQRERARTKADNEGGLGGLQVLFSIVKVSFEHQRGDQITSN